MSDRLTRFEGFGDAARARMTDALTRELTLLWSGAAAAGLEPERLAAVVDTWRARLNSARAVPEAHSGPRKPGPAAPVRARRAALAKAAAAAASFVGRTAELGRLLELLEHVGSGRTASAVITGEAGVGKSRLLTEFAERARRGFGVHVLRGSCAEFGEGAMPFAPLSESLRTLLGESGPRSARQAAGQAWDDLAALFWDTSDTPAAGPDVGVPGQARVFGAVRRMLEQLGATAPVLLIIEDLQWADQSTLDLVSYLTRTMVGERTLLTYSHRSAAPPGHGLRTLLSEPGFRRQVTDVELSPFTESELSAFLGGPALMDLDAVRRCREASQGNALFAEQLVASTMLADPRVRVLPRTLDELMAARTAQLSEAARRVLRVVAVAHRVDDRVLKAVSGLDDGVLDEALGECHSQGMIVLDSIDGRYTIPYTTLSSAVYTGMEPQERSQLHDEIAQALAANTLGPTQDCDAAVELAHHWHRARRHPEALAAAVQAGESAMRIRGFHEAESHYQRVLTLWDRVADPEAAARCSRERILLARADAARWAGHPGQAAEHVREAVNAAGPHADPRQLGELYERLGSYQREAQAMPADGHAYAEAVRLLAQAAPREAVYARALSGLALSEVRAGSHLTALNRAREAVALAYDCGDAGAENHALNAAGVALAVCGRPTESGPVLRHALDVADRADRLEDVLRTYRNLALTLEFAGDTAGSADQARAGLRRARALGLADTRQGAALAGRAGASLMLLGQWDEAAELLREELAGHTRAEHGAHLRLILAGIAVERGRFSDAERLIEELRGRRIADSWFTAAVHFCESELWCWRGRPVLAYGAAHRGLGATDDILMRMRLCAVGLRAAADHRARPAEAAAPSGGELIAVAVEEAAHRPDMAVVQVLRRQCVAEHHRAAGTDTAEQWATVATGWDAMERPYPAAYARWRQAAAGSRAADGAGSQNPGAVAPALQAVQTASRLGAEPLRAEVARLIERLGLGVA